jgi:4-aminobutyrate aminotransferase/(S)-3-amino-2-methylpropionate transaminase
MSHTEELIERRRAVVPRGVSQFAGDLSAVSGRGAKIIDADGREFIDFAGGIGVMNVGHSQQVVVDAIKAQVEKLTHTCIHVATYEPYIALCEKLVSILPHGDKTKVMLTNTGAEAVENAVKIARQATGRSAVMCYTEAFHGRTMMAMTLTSKAGYKVNCGPFAPEVYRLPYPNHYRYGDGLGMEAFVERELARFESAFLNMVPAEHVAAVIIEPVQGEGGFVAAPFEYLQGLRRICDERGILLITDEVQSGFCRTGRWGAFMHAGITPDLSTWAKSMGAGLPIGCVMGKAEIMDAARPGTLGGTYGGNPVACAGSLAAIQVMEELDLNHRATEIGKHIMSRLRDLPEKCGAVGEIRGLGAMIGIEFSYDRDPRKPATDLAADALKGCRERGLLAIPAGTFANIIRILVPLVIENEDLDRGLDILEESVMESARAHQVSG